MRRTFFSILFLLGVASLFFYFRVTVPRFSEVHPDGLQANLSETQTDNEIKLLFVGDIMLSWDVAKQISRHNDFYFPFLKAVDIVRSADVAFGNLEGPISIRGANQGSIYSFRADPRVIEGLTFAGFDVLSIANNHIWDWGSDALYDTLTFLKDAGIKPVGAGVSYSDANAPTVADVKGRRVAFFAYTNLYPDSFEASDISLGISDFDLPKVQEAIQQIRGVADVIVVSIHWGEEYKTQSNVEQQAIARALMNAGADLVVGHHPHVVQEVREYALENRRKAWVAYSLGNFVFDQNFSKETMEGLMLEVKVKNGKISEVKEIPVKINDTFQPEIFEEQ